MADAADPNMQPAPKLYEAMFLLSQQALSNGLSVGVELIREMLDRAGAKVTALSKWDERKLAYPIEGQKRGTFFLAVFEVEPFQIANIERDCNLSEDVLRVMFLRADHYGETELAEATRAAAQTADEVKLKEPEAAPVPGAEEAQLEEAPAESEAPVQAEAVAAKEEEED